MNQLYKLLKSCEKILLEKNSISVEDVQRLKKEFSRYKDSDEKWISHLAKASDSLGKTSNLNDLMVFLVPIERFLRKKVTDADFSISVEDRKEALKVNSLKVVLDNIRSAFNTGALYRTCETLGASEIILTGYTQDLENQQVLKTSMGAVVKTSRFRDLNEVRDYLREYELVALETSKESDLIYDSKLVEKTAFVVGNERFGLSESDLSLCDKVVCLPTFGVKNSLNVNAALSASGYEWVRRFG